MALYALVLFAAAASAFDCSTAVSFGGMPGATDVTASSGACSGVGCYSYSYTGTGSGASYDISASGCAPTASMCSDFATTADSGAAQIGATVSGWSCAVTAAATSTDATTADTSTTAGGSSQGSNNSDTTAGGSSQGSDNGINTASATTISGAFTTMAVLVATGMAL